MGHSVNRLACLVHAATPALAGNYGPGMFTDYWFGQGGPCDRFENGEWNSAFGPTTASYWCQPNGRVGTQYFVHSPESFVMQQVRCGTTAILMH